MSKPFKFKQFEIIQEKNPQKVGTDSMLLGAWTAAISHEQERFKPKRILDIGTGTGVLALMMAQSFPEATITAIEPNQDALEEAVQNFKNSGFSDQILAIKSRIQDFSALEKFDLIICNPPYFDGTYISGNDPRDLARHTIDLLAYELYEAVDDLLSEFGRFNFVIPHHLMEGHIPHMIDHELSLDHVLHTKKDSGEDVRLYASVWRLDAEPEYATLIVKDAKGKYSEEYIELTKDFYATDLRTIQN